jgi:hypothetical protein
LHACPEIPINWPDISQPTYKPIANHARIFFLWKFIFHSDPIQDQMAQPGVDVMITIFGDFCQFFGEKMAFFSKTDVMIKILHYLALFLVKNANFLQFFSAKIFKNHNIGPRIARFFFI